MKGTWTMKRGPDFGKFVRGKGGEVEERRETIILSE
jgi:hypothetical protein